VESEDILTVPPVDVIPLNSKSKPFFCANIPSDERFVAPNIPSDERFVAPLILVFNSVCTLPL
jgi:hypothetical protein